MAGICVSVIPPLRLINSCFFHTHSYFQPSLAKSLKADNQEANPIEMTSLVNDLDHSPFRSLRPRSQISSSISGVSSQKTQGPVVCSVAPNLPARPPSSSDNDSIRKNHWDMDYEGVQSHVFMIYDRANVVIQTSFVKEKHSCLVTFLVFAIYVIQS